MKFLKGVFPAFEEEAEDHKYEEMVEEIYRDMEKKDILSQVYHIVLEKQSIEPYLKAILEDSFKEVDQEYIRFIGWRYERENKGKDKLIAWTKEGGPMWKHKQIEAGMNKWKKAHKKVPSKIKKKW